MIRKRPARPVLAALLYLICVAVASIPAACSRAPAAESARLVLTADIRGRLVPCGCFTGQLGGMTRLYTALQKDKRSVPELRVDAGDAIGGYEDYHVMEYRHILEAFRLMEFDALNLGARETRISAEALRNYFAGGDTPLVSANVYLDGEDQPVVHPFVTRRLGGRKIIVTGIVDPSSIAPGGIGEGLRVKDPDLVLRELLPELRRECDLLVLLAFADENRLRHYAENFYEADFILGGDVSQPSGNTRSVNQSEVFYVANESRTVGLIDFDMKKADGRDRTAIDIRKAEPFLLYDWIPEAEAIVQLADAYREEIRHATLDIDRPGRLDENAIPGVHAAATYVGSESCMGCHQMEHEIWKSSSHADAWETLVHKNADADPNCIGCHSVGFGEPSGYRRAFEHEKLVNVGCESCHGPGSRHVEERRSGKPVTFHFRPLSEADCRSCHYGEFSRPFEWDAFWPVVAHGNGLRPTRSPDDLEGGH